MSRIPDVRQTDDHVTLDDIELRLASRIWTILKRKDDGKPNKEADVAVGT